MPIFGVGRGEGVRVRGKCGGRGRTGFYHLLGGGDTGGGC